VTYSKFYQPSLEERLNLMKKRSKNKQLKDKQRFKPFEQRMAEIDTAKDIIRNLNQRDLLTGEITFNQTNNSTVIQTLTKTQYSLDRDIPGANKHCKRQTERVWFNFDLDVDNLLLTFEHGEVLNRPIEPCWWR
jgi:ATP-dependent 26S proteasome regulatory subunit